MKWIRVATLASAMAFCSASASALPPGPPTFCSTYSNSPHCDNAVVQCTMCHTQPPARNPYGFEVASVLGDGEFAIELPIALAAVEGLDSDGDGLTNIEEIEAGSFPGLPDVSAECAIEIVYDQDYVFKRVSLDICGASPDIDEVEAFAVLSIAEKTTSIHARLDQCLNSEYWLGKNGALWEIANPKIRPIEALRVRGNFDRDYQLFAYTQIDGNDARDLLVGDYHVDFDEPTYTYTVNQNPPGQATPQNRRAGLMTTNWFLLYFTMFTAVPRNTASQAYRAYLGLDIARQEGLYPVANEPVDYDEKGVDAQGCEGCHSTLDPLSYPFASYCGFPQETYCPGRPATFANRWPAMVNLPEQGMILGQPVDDLLEWAQVGANSPEFAQSRVLDYWRRFFERGPLDTERPEFDELASRLMNENNYSVEAMLHDLVDTEAYGAR